MSTLQGARLYHDGQLEGQRTRIPVFLRRGPQDARTAICAPFTSGSCAPSPTATCATAIGVCANALAGPTTTHHRGLVSWCWSTPQARDLVVVNLSDAPAQARVRLPWQDLTRGSWRLVDRLTDQSFERDGAELLAEGLYVALEPWASHFLSLQA